MNKYGYFDDKQREYVITDPFPPVAWVNLLTNDNLTAVISQKSGGALFCGSAADGRMTKYNQEHCLPEDRPGFYLYVREADGTVWSPTFEPTRTPLNAWHCRHGMGYTVFEADYNGLCFSVTFFVDRQDDVFIWDIECTNKRQDKVKFKLFPYVEFNFLQAAREVMHWHWCRFFTTYSFDQKLQAIKYDYRVFEDEPKIKTFATSTAEIVSYNCERNSFIGRQGQLERPEEVIQGALSNKELPNGGHGIAAFQHNITLQPGESYRLAHTIGGTLSWPESEKLIKKYQHLDNIDAAKVELNNYWQNYLELYQAELPDQDMQRMINIWNPYNCSIGLQRKRSMTSQTTGMARGGIQTRDTMQDSMSLASLQPANARRMVEFILSFQYPHGEYPDDINPVDGTVAEHYAIRGDNGVWPVYTTYQLVAEAGDLDYLNKKLPYYNLATKEHEGEATIIDHLYQGLQHIHNNRGRYGLPLVIGVDWNDNLYIFRKDGKEESVMLAQQYVYACRLLIEMAENVQRQDIIDWSELTMNEMIDNINSPTIWDETSNCYKRYIFGDDEQPHLGSKERPEGKLFLNSQSWAVISGAGIDGRGACAMEQVNKILATDYGVKLFVPPFTGIPTPEDEMFNNGPGVRENGGVFHHAHTWGIMAETMLGHGDLAYKYYCQVLPNIASNERGEDVYKNEPYAISSTSLAEPCENYGEADMAWFTGTVTWMYLVGTQYILGIRPVLNGLMIDPSIPTKWSGFTVKRHFRGVTYNIVIKNPEHISKGVKSITIDGTAIQGNIIQPVNGKTTVDVEVIMG
jgi:cellobiose phosphorylase